MAKKEIILNPQKYAVVEFTDENTCGVIPSLWLTKNNAFCYYPNVPVFKTNSYIKNCVEPQFDGKWTECKVRVIGFEGDLLKARQKGARAELTSNLESEDDDNQRLRKRRKVKNSESDDSNSDPDERASCSKRPTLKIKPKKLFPNLKPPVTPLNSVQGRDQSQPSFSPAVTSSLPVVIDDPVILSTSDTAHPPSLVLAEGSGAPLMLSIPNFNPTTTSNETEAQSSSTSAPEGIFYVEQSGSNITLEQGQSLGINQCPGCSGFNSVVLRALGVLQEDVKQILRNQSTLTARPRPNLNLNVSLPVNSKEDFYQLNVWLIQQENRESLILNDLGLIGGEDLKGVVHGVLERIIGPGLNTQLNFTGKFKKVKLDKTNALKLILEAVRYSDHANGATDHTITKLIQKWLYGSSDRDGGREKRRNSKIRKDTTEKNTEEN